MSDYRVKIPNTLDSRGVLAKGKGVHREVESERSWRQSSGLTDRNCIRGNYRGMSLLVKTKSYTVRTL